MSQTNIQIDNNNTKKSKGNKKSKGISLKDFEEKSLIVDQPQTPVEEPAAFPDMETAGDTPIVFVDLVTEVKTDVNIWQLRAQAADALAKAKKAQEMVNTLLSQTAKIEKPAKSELPKKEVSEPTEESGFKKVLPKKKYQKTPTELVEAIDSKGNKVMIQKNSIVPVQSASKSTPQQQQSQFKKKSLEQNKTSEQYLNAFNSAQDQMIQEILNLIHPSDIDAINTEAEYQKNFKRVYEMDLTNDELVNQVDGQKYSWSRSHFFQNTRFQNAARNKIEKVLPLVWVLFFKGHSEGTQVIQLVRRKDNN